MSEALRLQLCEPVHVLLLQHLLFLIRQLPVLLAVKVLYFPSCENLREVVYMNGESCRTVPHELKIDFHADLMHVSDEHALLAHPTYRPWENWDAPYEDWMILLQVDSFEGKDFQLNLMDVGVLDFLISPSDLKQHSFDNVRAIVLSS